MGGRTARTAPAIAARIPRIGHVKHVTLSSVALRGTSNERLFAPRRLPPFLDAPAAGRSANTCRVSRRALAWLQLLVSLKRNCLGKRRPFGLAPIVPCTGPAVACGARLLLDNCIVVTPVVVSESSTGLTRDTAPPVRTYTYRRVTRMVATVSLAATMCPALIHGIEARASPRPRKTANPKSLKRKF